jgi:DNA modification methylase
MNIIEFGDCRETMRKWAQQGIKAQTCVTSPPYFGLRDYGHEGQIGLEETPEEYIAAMVDVFRCVRDVLADDGTVWLNIGDSYFSTTKGTGGAGKSTLGPNKDLQNIQFQKMDPIRIEAGQTGCKPKDLIGIPWMLAFALRADGWYLRQDIIWHKPNPMPESVQDRCTKAHEYIFLLSKSQKYYYDSKSIAEPHKDISLQRWGGGGEDTTNTKYDKETPQTSVGNLRNGSNPLRDGGANKRSVWTVTTKPYEGAHFAVFPSDLIEPCILAGAPVGGVVLDPFMGSGTTAQVAQNLGRKYLGCELNPDYKPLQEKRLRQQALELV